MTRWRRLVVVSRKVFEHAMRLIFVLRQRAIVFGFLVAVTVFALERFDGIVVVLSFHPSDVVPRY